MARYRTQWDLTITADTDADYRAAVEKVRNDAAKRLAELGEEWVIDEYALTRTVHARVVYAVDNLDQAG